MGKIDFGLVGIVGVVDFSVLALLVLWRWTSYTWDSVVIRRASQQFRKHFLYFLLLFASVCDIPLFVSFFRKGDYSVASYSFHKFEAAAIFGAYSLVISDWSRVLFKIREGSYMPFVFRRITLGCINAVLTTISIVNFGYCYSTANLESYASSNIYIVGLFIQIIAPFLLTFMMLHAGLKLYLRVYGASKKPNNTTSNNESKEFQTALLRLIVIMLSIGAVIFVQVLPHFVYECIIIGYG
jgi:hypothetical protein